MIEQSVSLASNGVVKVPGYEQLVRFGYTKNRGVYRLAVTATGEWEGLTIRCFWHVPGGKDPASSLVVDGSVAVPASVTAQPGDGCINFEGTNGTKTVTSADLRYRVSANSGTEDGTEPEPGTPAWQQLVDAVHTNATAAEQAKTDAQTAAQQAGASAKKAGQALSDTIAAKEDALKAIGDKQTAATQAVDTARDKAVKQVEASTKAAQTAASEATTSAGSANRSAEEAADSLQELKDGIASGDFKGEPGNDGKSPVVTVTDIENGHRVSITDKDGTKTIDVLNGQAGKDGTQIDDTAVTDSALWSSKHIVDMLCPPLEETGNPVQCYPVAGYPLGCKVSWEPTQDGTGDPSPDNIRPIKGRDSVTVNRADGLRAWKLITLDGTENWAAYMLPNNRGARWYLRQSQALADGRKAVTARSSHYKGATGTQTYNGDVGVSAYDSSVQIYDSDRAASSLSDWKSYLADQYAAGTPVQVVYKLAKPVVVPDANGIFFSEQPAQGGSGDPSPDNIRPILLNNAVQAGQTTTLTLPHTIYGGTVDAVTGDGQETWKLLTLDGTETWNSMSTVVSGKYGFYMFAENIQSAISPSQKGGIVCNKYATKTADDTYRVQVGISVEAYPHNYFRIYDDAYADKGVDTWKSYLAAQYAAGTPVQVCYKLATPTPITATGAQPIPALSGINAVLTDADKLTVTGRADPIKRITDLEDALASMT